MSSKRAVWLSFFLNFSYAIVEFIAGGVFGSSAVLADSVHDLGDAIAIGISAFLESISNREEDSHYTLGYKRFSLLGALVTAVILMTGSVLVPLLSLIISFFILSKAIPRFWSTLKIFLDAVPEGVDIKQVKSDLEQLDHVASINQLNLWTMDGLEKNAIVHVCLKEIEQMEVCKESIRDLLKDCGFQNVTNMAELEANRNHGHDHS